MTEAYETLLVIVGREEGGSPFIIGGLNNEYLNQMPLEDVEAQIEARSRPGRESPGRMTGAR